jgi:predicted HTH domain antitoxin
MVKLTLEFPEKALAAVRQSPDGFGRALRLAAAVKWYELEVVSQERAAEIAGLSRAEFLAELARFGVSPFQGKVADTLEEAGRG